MTSATTKASLTLANGVTREFLLHHRCCPVRFQDNDSVVIAIAPSGERSALDDLSLAYRRRAVAEDASESDVDGFIERLTTSTDRSIELASMAERDDYDALADVRDLASQPPVVRYVNLLVRDAYDAGASDVHLEATRDGLLARVRLDGVLTRAPEPPPALHHAVISRVKLLAELDIAERRRPQDGRIRVRLESRELDLRVSTVPTIFGESIVLRLLDRGGRPVRLQELGMNAQLLARIEQLVSRPHGMFLVTGPTGSGKTTTLYAALQQRDTGAEKIVTVEDPIEYELPGITQVPVHRQSGVAFDAALRSLLRQDPDVIMVGEMRDSETAEVAVQAAMTGHLVFSTLHTNDVIGAIPRLQDLGVPPYLISATLEGILAQRLVRRICDQCCEVSQPPKEQVVALMGEDFTEGQQHLKRGTGCAHCRGTGFRGRTGIYELLVLTEELKDAITRGAPRSQLRMLAEKSGLRTMQQDGWDKVKAGVTTTAEVLRVVQS
jgi:general secretion pathway protein E